jgi:hypothetical protein
MRFMVDLYRSPGVAPLSDIRNLSSRSGFSGEKVFHQRCDCENEEDDNQDANESHSPHHPVTTHHVVRHRGSSIVGALVRAQAQDAHRGARKNCKQEGRDAQGDQPTPIQGRPSDQRHCGKYEPDFPVAQH